MRWFTSDQHFCHARILEYCRRPFASLDEMHAGLIAGYQEVVGPDDEVFFLGDLGFCQGRTPAAIMARLPGRKVLVRGNHDRLTETQYVRAGFESVCTRLEVEVGRVPVTLCHYPYLPAVPSVGYDLRYQDRRPADTGGWLLHGHVHEVWKTRDRMVNVGVDVWDYRPVSEAVLQALMEDG